MSDAQPKGETQEEVPRRGIAGKWGALNDERESLRTERDQLRQQVQQLLAEKKAHAEIEELGLSYNEEEDEVSGAILFIMQRIVSDWGLRVNIDELGAAVHVLQSFVIQHMLIRLSPPGKWGMWYETLIPKDKEEKGK